ncbi:hypothetical protein Acr_02g0009150 [Actinidia rufa]|uniref:Uncharacterized protein n=1 Tax=Actinidia rufa TaxID=165716 RepID=A0A7J0E8H4_9ERIC|nr:hypothetical protein Acr_02g0009150 [Actinidia rufa]
MKNEAEYEAVIARLRMAKASGVVQARVRSDSPYEMVRSNNEKGQLTSANEGESGQDMILEYLAKPSIDQQEEIDIQFIEICIICPNSVLFANHAEDALAFIKKWFKYQKFNNIPLKPLAELTILTKSCPSAQLGIDIVVSTKW